MTSQVVAHHRFDYSCYNPSKRCLLCMFLRTTICRPCIFDMLRDFYLDGTLGFVFRRSPLFAAFARIEAVKRKAKAKNNAPDSHEPILNCLVVAKGLAGTTPEIIKGTHGNRLQHRRLQVELPCVLSWIRVAPERAPGPGPVRSSDDRRYQH